MVVYQALMTLVGSAQVVSVLDDEKYQTSLEERGYWRSDTDKALIGPLPATPVLTDEYGEDDEPVDPEKLMCKVYVNNKWRSEAAYTRHNVTWLNNAPHANSSKEFAAAFITVSLTPFLPPHPPTINKCPVLACLTCFLAVWERAQSWCVLLVRRHHCQTLALG